MDGEIITHPGVVGVKFIVNLPALLKLFFHIKGFYSSIVPRKSP